MSDDLKPCPFCGEPGELVDQEDHKWYAQCGSQVASCCQIPNQRYGSFRTPEAAAKAWNTRPIEDVLAAIVEANTEGTEPLEDVLKELDL